MPDFITLTCPTCGGKLQITDDVERFACSHCGNEHVVRRAGGTVSLAPVMAGLKEVKASTDRVGAELAIQRLTREMDEALLRRDLARDKQLKIARTPANPSGLILGLVSLLTALGAVFALVGVATLVTGNQSSAAPMLVCGGGGALLGVVVIWTGIAARASRNRALKAASAEVQAAQAGFDRASGERTVQGQAAKS